MSATPTRRRVGRVVVLAFASLLVLGGCTSVQKAPKDYAGAEDNFLEGCQQIASSDNGKVDDKGQTDTTKISSPKAYCQCVFDAISGKNGVPYSEFKKIQSDMQDTGGPLPASFIKEYAKCKPSETSGS